MEAPMRSTTAAFLALLFAPALACSGGATGSSASTTTSTASDGSSSGTAASTSTTGGETTGDTTTATTGAPLDPCEGDEIADGEVVAWDRGQPTIGGCEIRGVRDYRAIIHLHSPHSHDACDGEPQPGGVLDEDCLQDLRDALCTTRIDVAFLSDHPAHAEEATIEEMALHRGDDELVKDGEGRVVGNWLNCANGHRALLIPGVESGSMMPLGLHAHPPAGTYGESSPETFAAAKAAGAALWVAHTEGRDVDELATLGLDGIEFYQLHANLDPEIREEDLGLDANGFLADTLPFFYPVGDDAPQPDLASVAFVVPNEPSIVALETLGQGQRLTISAGTDAHQNVASTVITDGERVDSYRRMMRWFNNRLRIDGELSVASAKAALTGGRNHIVFESFGTPQGFDLYADAGGAITEMGAEVTLTPGLRIEATLPRLDRRSPQSTRAPAIRGVLYRADGDGRSVVAEWDEGALSQPVDAPGVYRVEVLMTPRHLDVHLGSSAALAEVEKPWIYSGAIFVRE
jgi:hypothetical protein